MTIKLIGIGNGGCNIIDDIRKDEFYTDAQFVYCDYEARALSKHGRDYDCRFQLNLEQPNVFSFADERTDLTIIASTLGGLATSRFSAQITEACKKSSKMVLGVLTLPFEWEGSLFLREAKQTLEVLKPLYDAFLIQDNGKLPKGINVTMMNMYLCSSLKKICMALKEPHVEELNNLSETDAVFIDFSVDFLCRIIQNQR